MKKGKGKAVSTFSLHPSGPLGAANDPYPPGASTIPISPAPQVADDATETPSGEVSGWNFPGLNHPTFHLVLVAKAIDRLTIKMLGEICDLTIAEWRVLSRLAPIEGATVRQVAQMAWVDRAEVSRAAASLEANGYTSRRNNPADGRAPILFVTQVGRELYDRLLPSRSDFHLSLASDLSEAERASLDTQLLKLARKLVRLSEDQGG